MTIANINIGTSPNDGTGDTLRHGFQIVNNNFSYISSILGGAGNIVTTSVTADTITANTGNITNVTIGNLTTTIIAATSGTYGSIVNSGNISTGNLTASGRVTAGNITANATVTAANVTITSNVSAAGAVVTGNVFGAGFFYSNGVAIVGTTGNLTITSSNIAGADSNDGRGTVLNLIPNVAQAPNGQFLTLDSTTYPNISIKPGDTAVATLILGQSTNGISVFPTSSTGNIFINPYGGGTTANGVFTADNIIVRSNITTGNLIGIFGTQYSHRGNITDANTTVTVNVAMQPVFARTAIITANANVALDFRDDLYPIVRGTERVVYIRNTSAGNITVSNVPAYNNKGATTTTISSGIVGRFVFFAGDTTFGNIIATVTNN